VSICESSIFNRITVTGGAAVPYDAYLIVLE